MVLFANSPLSFELWATELQIKSQIFVPKPKLGSPEVLSHESVGGGLALTAFWTTLACLDTLLALAATFSA
jgi:hypothetical protein